ncbi:MAG: aminodeoxychorismate synthase component I [Planctomycetes bacterium]|nr:aminodeoxychorismate synthase component I [Planctomycetota bacterium]
MSIQSGEMKLKWDARVVAAKQWGTVEQVLLGCADRAGLAVLESYCGHEIYGRYSFVTFDPVATLRCNEQDDIDPFDALDDPLSRYGIDCGEEGLPFIGGWVGYLAYEAGRFLERLPQQTQRDLDLPFACFGLYDTLGVFDHLHERWHVAGVELPTEFAPHRPKLAERLDHMESLITAAADQPAPVVAIQPTPRFDVLRNHDEYVRGVRRILEYIRAGDIYQANLTTRFGIPMSSNSIDLYRSLRQHNPADYMAYLDCGDHQVLCSSPELFLRVAGDQVLTRPIKGTRARVGDAAEDRAVMAELLASEKDLAELAMIVDLERNDIGRVCDEVSADWPPMVETYTTVHHLVADVRGRIGESNRNTEGWVPHAESVIDILRATFPGGSITGAPKIRAMEIIDELETVARGPYCGAIGYIGFDGRMAMNIAIRTMIVKDGQAYVHAGSGIVADSDPESEYRETMAKAKGMLAALGVDPK